MEYIIATILLVGLGFIQNELRQIFYQIRAIREHTHNSHMRLLQISQSVDKAVYKYTYTY